MARRPQSEVTSRQRLAAALIRLPLLTLAWGALSEGAGFWPWGLGAAAALTLPSLALVPPKSGRVASAARLLRLLPLFLRDSLSGGWDVARRALSPTLPLRPGLETISLERAGTPEAIALAYAVTLMPGTLAVEASRRRLLVHVIDRMRDSRTGILALERRLARAPREPSR